MFQDRPLCYPTCRRRPGRVLLINLSCTTHLVSFLCSCPSILYPLGYKNIVEGSIESSSEVKVSGIHQSPLVHKPSYFNVDGHQIGQVLFILGKSMLAVPSHHLFYVHRNMFPEDLLRDQANWSVVPHNDLSLFWKCVQSACLQLLGTSADLCSLAKIIDSSLQGHWPTVSFLGCSP